MSSDQPIPSSKYFQDRVILASGNDDICSLNLKTLQHYP
jgi:hypothetical protein